MLTFGLVFMVYGCTETESKNETENTEPIHSFQGKDFILQSSEGYEPLGEAVYLSFAATSETLSFSAGCNSFDGEYTYDGRFLGVETMGGTEMACDMDLMTQDEWFVDFFTNYLSLSHDGDTLILEFIDDNHSTPDIKLTFVDE